MQEDLIMKKTDRNDGRKVLMIATCNFLTAHNDGGRQVSYNNYKLLCDIFGKENVILCMITNDEVMEENVITMPTFHTRFEQVIYTLQGRNGYNKKVEKKILKLIEDGSCEYIWFDRSTLGGLCRKVQSNVYKIVFFHNIEKKYICNKIRHEGIGYLTAYRAFAENEKKAIQYADALITLNMRDQKILMDEYGRTSDFILPVFFEDIYDEKKLMNSPYKNSQGKQVLLFVGSFFGPNIQGIEWLISNVIPRLPNCILYIVGKGMEVKEKEWNSSNVQVVGSVKDLAPYYRYADAVVLPIFYGDGMKVKTAEALMYGKVIFGTKEAFEGYQIEKSEDMVLCDSAEEFCMRIEEYFSKGARETFSKSNRQYFLEYHQNATLKNKLEKFIFSRREN